MFKKSKFAVWLIICVVMGFVFILPFFWMISTSLMGTEQIVKYPPDFIPCPVTLRSFQYIFESTDFFIYLKNSCIITTLNIVGTLVSTTLVAYGFAKYAAQAVINLLV